MTPLEQKLNQLSLSTMSRQLETTLTEAAAKNLSVRADSGVARRYGTRSPQRDVPLSAASSPPACRPQPSIDAFHFHHHKSRMQAKTRHSSPARSLLPRQRHQRRAHRQPWRRKDILGEAHRLARLPGQSARPVHHRHGHAQSSARFPGRSLTGAQAQRPILNPHCSIWMSWDICALDQQTSNLFYQVISTRHSQKRSTVITTNTAVLRLGQHPLQYDHRHRHRRPAGRELRDFPAGRRQSPQSQQESRSAGRVGRAPIMRRAVMITRSEESAG